MTIDRNRLCFVLGELQFEPGRWVVAGSAPMLMAGLLDSIADIDIVVDGVAWEHAMSLAERAPRDGMLGDHVVDVEVAGARIEVFDGWLGAAADEMIAEAVEIDGFRFSPLERVAESKQRLGRPKDELHLSAILRRLAEEPTAGSRELEAEAD